MISHDFWPTIVTYFRSFRWREPRGLPGLHQAGRLVPGLGARPEQKEQEAPRSVLQGADPGAGEALPSAALPVRAREGAAGPPPQPDPHPGEDLVPEPPLQDEERPGGGRAAGRGDTASSSAAASRRCSDPGPGRETISHLLTRHGEIRLFTSLSGGSVPLSLPVSAAPVPRRSSSSVPAALSHRRGLQIRLEGLLERLCRL